MSFEDNIYFVMVDRFNDAVPNLNDVDKDDSKAYHGGDIKGITEKLDYIKSLGFTAVWLTPIMDNAPKGYHGYWIHDFYKVDEHFGTIEDF
ncbi:MAG: alpha-amylase family glycosyl hydrolase, partial [Clostridia bacterium]|nr:alpha-amylase family glycosyl hydrolase [Clostridia bacterium]